MQIAFSLFQILMCSHAALYNHHLIQAQISVIKKFEKKSRFVSFWFVFFGISYMWQLIYFKQIEIQEQ